MGVKLRKIRGKWYLVIDFKGRRKSKAISTSRAVAEEVRRKVEARLALGDMGIFDEDPDKDSPTIEDYADKWLNTYIRVRFKPATFFSYRASLQTHVFPYLGKQRLNRIRPATVEQFIYKLTTQEEPPAQGTVRLALCVLRSMLSHAKKNRVIETNPAKGLAELSRSNKPSTREGQAMTRREAEQFLTAVENLFPEMYPLFLTAIRTGMRRGELAALRWGDVNFGESAEDANRFFLVQRNYVYRSFGTPKSGHGRRVDMSKQLRAVLSELRDRRMLTAMMNARTSIADDLVFTAGDGKPLVVDTLSRHYLVPALAAAGLRKFKFHDLRHTFATLLIQSGASLAYVQKQLGHSSIAITVDTYGHLEPSANIAWADRLDTEAQKSADRTQTRENRATIEPVEDAEKPMVSMIQVEGVLTAPPYIYAPARPSPS